MKGETNIDSTKIVTICMAAFLFSFPIFAQTPLKGDAAAGKAKFAQFCATCHGAAGKGDGPASAALSPKPRDLGATKKTDAELKKIIKDGGQASGLSPLMPPWGASLSEQDISNVITYIRSLVPKTGK